ncbi:alpha/beta-hydrolase [Dacryopinax primogenitus]|uniref:Carboxylic ester hydrolase n=1 Tax=Dacryopinax primogenitus (strain DJM 731) TaxID=1858805 RepID=M5FWR0_DACPD|nr:alpha/beta-hydrolase [Dacryopinax primogenitus]EJU02391.1 alpha/beta-hydrolase [Dacryopinax primogenitus]
MLLQLAFSLGVLHIGAVGCSPIEPQAGTLVDTAQGPVQGMLVSAGVRQWLGIPFAASTGGSLRFEPPQPAPSRFSTFSATQFGDSCPAILSAEFLELLGMLQQQESVPFGEDCLSLNIWSPATTRPQGGAILLWVYGGSGQFGTSNTPYYNGQTFVANFDDIVIVTINYRLNIFGGPNAPQQTLDLSMLDMEAAIQWVYANIAAFGGDPERITLFGESAGAIAVDAYGFIHPDDTIVKGIIAESGTASLAGNSSTDSSAYSAADSPWNTVASALGCGTTDDAAQFACMQSVPWQDLLNEVISSGQTFGGGSTGLVGDVSALSSEGKFLKVPFLVGNNANEGDIFVVEMEEENLNTTIPIVGTVISDAITILLATCPASKEAGDRVDAGVPTWRYMFEGAYPDLTNNNPNLRAYHGEEIALVFGTYNYSTFPYPPTANEIELSSWIQGAWVAFARDPVHGLTNYGWPEYGSSVLWPVAALGNPGNPGGATYEAAVTFDLTCDVLDTVEAIVENVVALLGDLL